jgi:hypothetical protein
MYHLTPKSNNAKVGAIPVSTTSNVTCPTSCPLKGNGCYAESGPLAIHWKKVSNGERGMDFDEFLSEIRRLPQGQIWRYAQAGDLPGNGDHIDPDHFMGLVAANDGRPVIAYTHKPPTDDNLRLLQEGALRGFRVNLSADSLEEADEFLDKGLPVVVVLHDDYGRKTVKGKWAETLTEYRERLKGLSRKTPKGRDIAVCPATVTDTSCAQCQVCARKDNIELVIGFPSHGTRKKTINARLGEPSHRSTQDHDAVV